MINDVNINAADCIIKATGLFSTTVTNICSGSTVTVQRGGIDIFMGVLVIGVVIAALVTLFVAMFGIWRAIQ